MKTKEIAQTSVNHPIKGQLTFLLLAELKSRKLSSLLHELGVEECPWLPSLNEPIAEALGLSTDEQFMEYDKMVNECVSELNNESNVADVARQLVYKLQVAGCKLQLL